MEDDLVKIYSRFGSHVLVWHGIEYPVCVYGGYVHPRGVSWLLSHQPGWYARDEPDWYRDIDHTVAKIKPKKTVKEI